MASIGTLYTIPSQAAGIRIRAVAALTGLTVDLPENYVHHQDNLKPEFLSRFPHGKIPAFEGKNGFKLFEAAAIARYFATLKPESGLLGANAEEAALVDQWVSFADSEVAANTTFLWQLINGVLTPYSKAMHDTSIERQVRSLKTLEASLAGRAFLVGERLTLADLTVASVVRRACVVDVDAGLRAQFPNVVRHSEAVVALPQLKGLFVEVKYREEPLTYTELPKEK